MPTIPTTRLTDWTPGSPLTASHLQEPVTALRDRQTADAARVASDPDRSYVRREGVIVDKGPNGEAAPAIGTAQYWVQESYIAAGGSDDQIQLENVPAQGPTVTFYKGDQQISDEEVYIFKVTNLPEIDAGTQNLAVGTPVEFWEQADAGDPSNLHYLMCLGGAGSAPALLYGIQQGAWTPGSNTVTVKPCNSESDATPTGDPNVTAYISCPISGTCTLYAGASGDILVCQKLKGGAYLILSPKITPAPAAYESLQGDPAGTYFVVDYVHGI